MDRVDYILQAGEYYADWKVRVHFINCLSKHEFELLMKKVNDCSYRSYIKKLYARKFASSKTKRNATLSWMSLY